VEKQERLTMRITIGTFGGLVALFSISLQAAPVPPARQHVLPPAKQIPEKRDLRGGRGSHSDTSRGIGRLFGLLLCLHTGQHVQLLSDLRPLPVERG
jgi:hypothetical protein